MNEGKTLKKLPIIVQDKSQQHLGISGEEEEAYGYFLPNDISAIVQAHDETLGPTPINLEATGLYLKGGNNFFIPLHIEDVMKLLY